MCFQKNGKSFLANRVMEGTAICLFVEASKFLMEYTIPEMEAYGVGGLDMWDEWTFDPFEDMDVAD